MSSATLRLSVHGVQLEQLHNLLSTTMSPQITTTMPFTRHFTTEKTTMPSDFLPRLPVTSNEGAVQSPLHPTNAISTSAMHDHGWTSYMLTSGMLFFMLLTCGVFVSWKLIDLVILGSSEHYYRELFLDRSLLFPHHTCHRDSICKKKYTILPNQVRKKVNTCVGCCQVYGQVVLNKDTDPNLGHLNHAMCCETHISRSGKTYFV